MSFQLSVSSETSRSLTTTRSFSTSVIGTSNRRGWITKPPSKLGVFANTDGIVLFSKINEFDLIDCSFKSQIAFLAIGWMNLI
ncbi:MAG: hypothetical protein AAGJ08_00615 [Cyanobacteria bacterium P01_H01_bin.35]